MAGTDRHMAEQRKTTQRSRKRSTTKSPDDPPKKKTKTTTKKATRNKKTTTKRSSNTRKRARAAGAKVSTSSRQKAGQGPDAIAQLKQDHRVIEGLFKRFERAGDRAHRTKRDLVDAMIEGLSRHAAIEELAFYPAVRAEVDASDSEVLEALEEHHVVKVILRELEDADPSDERFNAKVTVMIENVRHHVEEEEGELFPDVRDAMTRRRLLELGDALRDAKSRAPTRPHPASPDEPPGNALVGGAVAALDRARTVGREAVRRVREEVPAV